MNGHGCLASASYASPHFLRKYHSRADQADEQQEEGPGVPRRVLDQRLDFHLDRLLLNAPQQVGQLLGRQRLPADVLGHRRQAGQQRGIGHGIVELQILLEDEKSRSRAADRRAVLARRDRDRIVAGRLRLHRTRPKHGRLAARR